jgi:hypothetical protein
MSAWFILISGSRAFYEALRDTTSSHWTKVNTQGNILRWKRFYETSFGGTKGLTPSKSSFGKNVRSICHLESRATWQHVHPNLGKLFWRGPYCGWQHATSSSSLFTCHNTSQMSRMWASFTQSKHLHWVFISF